MGNVGASSAALDAALTVHSRPKFECYSCSIEPYRTVFVEAKKTVEH